MRTRARWWRCAAGGAAGRRRGLENRAAGRVWIWWRPRCGGAGPRSASWVRCWTGWPGGRPAVVLIEGEAGIGKTRLLDTALEDARARGMQVALGPGRGAGAAPAVRAGGGGVRVCAVVG